MRNHTTQNNLMANSLSLIKLLAALQVVYSHLVEHMNITLPPWLLNVITYFRGVPIFFIISGFLIWFSIERSTTYIVYLKKRFWRIYPELWLAVVIEIVTILVLYDHWNFKHITLFAFTQGTVFQFWTPASLRGYGCGTPNGTLWTICVMIQFYIIAWSIYKLFHKKNLLVWITGFIVLVGMSVAGQIVFSRIDQEVLSKLYGQTIIRFAWLFFIGTFLAEFKAIIVPYLIRFWYLLLIAGIFPFITGFDIYAGYYILWSIFLVCGLIGFAYRFPQLAVSPDISYGIFLYHMIIMNVFIVMNWTGRWWYILALFVITIGCSYFSTVTVGKWSSKKRLYELERKE